MTKEGIPNPNNDFLSKLKPLEGSLVEIRLKDGRVIKGRLNHLGAQSALSGKPWIVVDTGITQTLNVEDIGTVIKL